MSSDPGRTYDQPLDVDTLDGEVVITGPGPAGIALTAQAAAKSAARLAAAAARASHLELQLSGARPNEGIADV